MIRRVNRKPWSTLRRGTLAPHFSLLSHAHLRRHSAERLIPFVAAFAAPNPVVWLRCHAELPRICSYPFNLYCAVTVHVFSFPGLPPGPVSAGVSHRRIAAVCPTLRNARNQFFAFSTPSPFELGDDAQPDREECKSEWDI